VTLGIRVEDCVSVGVSLAELEAVALGVAVGDGVPEALGMGEGVVVGLGDQVLDAVRVTFGVPVSDADAVFKGFCVLVRFCLPLGECVCVCVPVLESDRVALGVALQSPRGSGNESSL